MHYAHSGKKKTTTNAFKAQTSHSTSFSFVGGDLALIFFLNNFLVVLANLLKTLLRVSRLFFRVLRSRRLRNENKNEERRKQTESFRRLCGVGGVIELSMIADRMKFWLLSVTVLKKVSVEHLDRAFVYSNCVTKNTFQTFASSNLPSLLHLFSIFFLAKTASESFSSQSVDKSYVM